MLSPLFWFELEFLPEFPELLSELEPEFFNEFESLLSHELLECWELDFELDLFEFEFFDIVWLSEDENILFFIFWETLSVLELLFLFELLLELEFEFEPEFESESLSLLLKELFLNKFIFVLFWYEVKFDISSPLTSNNL